MTDQEIIGRLVETNAELVAELRELRTRQTAKREHNRDRVRAQRQHSACTVPAQSEHTVPLLSPTPPINPLTTKTTAPNGDATGASRKRSGKPEGTETETAAHAAAGGWPGRLARAYAAASGGGSIPPSVIGRTLKPLVAAHGIDEVEARLKVWARSPDARFGLPLFARDWAKYDATPGTALMAASAANGRLGPTERIMAVMAANMRGRDPESEL